MGNFDSEWEKAGEMDPRWELVAKFIEELFDPNEMLWEGAMRHTYNCEAINFNKARSKEEMNFKPLSQTSQAVRRGNELILEEEKEEHSSKNKIQGQIVINIYTDPQWYK